MAKSDKTIQSDSLRKMYMAEFNRCKGDTIANVLRRLRRKGYAVSKLGHKTTVLIRRPPHQKFNAFKDDLAELVQPRIGGLILSSTSGKFWRLDNTGNQPGVLQRVTADDL